MSKSWDDEYYNSNEERPRNVVKGLCVKCPPPYADESVTVFGTKATHKYNQVEPMCEKHYEETIATVEAICKSKVTESERRRHKL